MKLIIRFYNSSSKTFSISLCDCKKKEMQIVIETVFSVSTSSYTSTLSLSFSGKSSDYGYLLVNLNDVHCQFSYLKMDIFAKFRELSFLDSFSDVQNFSTLKDNLQYLLVSRDFQSMLLPFFRDYRSISKMIFKNHMIFQNHHSQSSFKVTCASEGSEAIAHDVIYQLSFSQGARSEIWMNHDHPIKNKDHRLSKKSFLMSRELVTPFDRGKTSSWIVGSQEDQSSGIHPITGYHPITSNTTPAQLNMNYLNDHHPNLRLGRFAVGIIVWSFLLLQNFMFSSSQITVNFLVSLENFFSNKIFSF